MVVNVYFMKKPGSVIRLFLLVADCLAIEYINNYFSKIKSGFK